MTNITTEDRQRARCVADSIACLNNVQCLWPDMDCSHHKFMETKIMEALADARQAGRDEQREIDAGITVVSSHYDYRCPCKECVRITKGLEEDGSHG